MIWHSEFQHSYHLLVINIHRAPWCQHGTPLRLVMASWLAAHVPAQPSLPAPLNVSLRQMAPVSRVAFGLAEPQEVKQVQKVLREGFLEHKIQVDW